jgi:hypothetical protein
MKSIIKTFVFLAALTSCGTGEEQTKTTEYRVIKNLSSHQVKLTITANKQYQHQLAMGDSVVFVGYVLSGGAGATYTNIGWDNSAPISGKIVFDNEKQIVYTNGSCENGRNPLNPNIYELHSCGYFNANLRNGTSDYVYEINDADYALAIPIVN